MLISVVDAELIGPLLPINACTPASSDPIRPALAETTADPDPDTTEAEAPGVDG